MAQSDEVDSWLILRFAINDVQIINLHINLMAIRALSGDGVATAMPWVPQGEGSSSWPAMDPQLLLPPRQEIPEIFSSSTRQFLTELHEFNYIMVMYQIFVGGQHFNFYF